MDAAVETGWMLFKLVVIVLWLTVFRNIERWTLAVLVISWYIRTDDNTSGV